MDVPPWVGQGAPSPPAPLPTEDLGQRLRAVEDGLAELKSEVAAVTDLLRNTELLQDTESLQEAVRAAVADDVASVSADLRHTVSELGRLLVRDLGRLSKMLTEHQQAVLNAIGDRPAATGSGWVSHPPSPAAAAPDGDPGTTEIPVADGATEEGAARLTGGWRSARRQRKDA